MPTLWRQFEELLPDSPVLVGTVVTSHLDGTVTVQLLGGGLVRARRTELLVLGSHAGQDEPGAMMARTGRPAVGLIKRREPWAHL
ncbi:hypothetical protein AB6Q13_23195 [Ralstonia solanacearum]|uniref:hypothetical protein n=1 Tax=Ralstonia solanacearum TaxID=305 RepID=UPI002304F847|nr:hypothetical protein [Ralstonia solanacearum]MDB0566200.1 hypothetical protein [Ralstonia solanacearum]MDB0574845.1 hypothetical protein [Ralstonia solanacearum]